MKSGLKAAAIAGAVSFGLFAKANRSYRNKTAQNPDYLLILGCTVHGETPCDILVSRVKSAAEFLKNNPETKVICCGGIVQKDQLVSEAFVMKKMLTELGIEEDRIILEDKSKTTYQNFANAVKILRSKGNTDEMYTAFITSEIHVMRASLIAKEIGLNAVGLSAPSPEGKYLKALIREFFVFPYTVSEIKKGE